MPDTCGISSASLKAVPFPDGTAHAELKLDYGSSYSRNTDGAVQPLVFIGNDVYGIQQKPFLDFNVPSSCTVTDDHQCASTTIVPDNAGTGVATQGNPRSSDASVTSVPTKCSHRHLTCTYHFIAQTDGLRSAQTFLVRDIAWDTMTNGASIQFSPMFSGLTVFSPPASGDSAANGSVQLSQTGRAPAVKPVYAINGANFGMFGPLEKKCKSQDAAGGADSPYGLTLYIDGASSQVACGDFTVLSDTTGTLQFQQAPKGKSVKLVWQPTSDYASASVLPVAWDLSVSAPEQAAKPSPSPSFVYRGDSQTVTFTGVDFSSVVDVKFESTVLTLASPPTAKKLEVQIPVSVTTIPGHKELVADTLDKSGKKGTIVLSIDVFHR